MQWYCGACRCSSLLACLAIVVSNVPCALAGEWTDNTGRFRVEADFVSIAGDQVILRKADGKAIIVPLSRLNALGRQTVATLAKAAAGTKASEPVPAPTAKPRLAAPSRLKWYFVQRTDLAVYTTRQFGQWSLGWKQMARSLVQQSFPLAKRQHTAQVAVAPMAPDETIRNLARELAAHRPRAAWDALPASYQRDAQSLVHTFGKRMDAEVWKSATQVLEKLIVVLRTQQGFFLAHPLISNSLQETIVAMTAAIPVATPAPAAAQNKQTQSSWEAGIEVLSLLSESELADLSKLRQLDFGRFLDTTGVQLMQQLSIASKISTDDAFNHSLHLLAGMDVQLVSMAKDEAIIRLTSAGQSEENRMVRVEGKWIPADLATVWPALIFTADAYLHNSNAAGVVPPRKSDLLKQLQQVDAQLDKLLAAKTLAEFDQALQQLFTPELPVRVTSTTEASAASPKPVTASAAAASKK